MLGPIVKSLAYVLNHFSRVQLSATLWTVAHQATLSIVFSRQEYWSGLSCPPPGDLLDPGMEPASPVSPALQVDSLPLSHKGSLRLITTIIIILQIITLKHRKGSSLLTNYKE